MREPRSNRESVIPSAPDAKGLIRRQIRGSIFLLLGRLLSISLNLASQILLVRYLSVRDYGAFAYGLSILTFCGTFSSLGLRSAIPRFVPIFHERRDQARLSGTLLIVVGGIAVGGAIVILTVFFGGGLLESILVADPQALALLGVLIFLVPVQALDLGFVNLFASFGESRSIFFRKHLLGPALKLLVVAQIVISGGSVMGVAQGYLAAHLLGLAISGWLLKSIFARENIHFRFPWRKTRLLVRQVFGYALPALGTDLVPAVMHSINVIILGRYWGTAGVAAYAVVVPLARLNRIVLGSVTILFTPNAARLAAREDRTAISELYWHTALWTSVLSFPIFAVTFTLVRPLIEVLYGAEYGASGIFVALLSLSYFFNASLGCNSHTLKVLGKIKTLVAIDSVILVVCVTANLVLVPVYGALGAAVSTAGAMILQNSLRQIGLWKTGIELFDRTYIVPYLALLGCLASLLGLRILGLDSLAGGAGLALLAFAVVLFAAKKQLRVRDHFHEFDQLPLIRALIP